MKIIEIINWFFNLFSFEEDFQELPDPPDDDQK